jgi:hypothetical protein
MKRTVMCLAIVLLFVGFANAQTESMVGTVVDYTVGNSGKWAGIDLKVSNKKYFVYTESANLPAPKIVGKVDEVGRTVQVFYTRIVKGQPGYDGELRATKIVEIKAASQPAPPGRATNTREGMIPSEIQSLLNSKYQGWRLAEPSREDRQTCFDKRTGFQPSIVWGDFNGDRQRDYAVLITQRRQVILVVFLNQGTTYTEYAVNSDPVGGTIPVLGVSKRGEKYFDHERNRNGIYPLETVTATYCESSAVSFIFRNGRFTKVFVSD